MADRDMREADFRRNRRQHFFMRRVAKGVHQNDRQRPQAFIIGGLQRRPRAFHIKRFQHIAPGVNPFVNLHDFGVQRRRQFNLAHE